MENKIVVNLNTKTVVLKINDFDTDIDTDILTKIQYHNILGEILTFPVLMNRIGNLKAEIDEIVSLTKLESEIKIAGLEEHYRRSLTNNSNPDKVKAPTIAEVEAAVKGDPLYENLKKRLFRVQKESAYIDSLYWSAKSKDDKLNRLSEKLRPEEFEKDLLEETINGIQILVKDKLIK